VECRKKAGRKRKHKQGQREEIEGRKKEEEE
jgi:hypothetical protein